MEHRVQALEKSQAEIIGKLDKLLDRGAVSDVKLASIEAKLDAKASSSEVAKIDPLIKSVGDLQIEVRTLRDNARVDYRWLFGLGVGATLGLTSLIAKIAHWF